MSTWLDGTSTPRSAHDLEFAVSPRPVVAPTVFNTDVTISATSEATANTVVTATAFTPDGSSDYWLDFYAPGVQLASTAGASVLLVLYDNGSVYGTANAMFAQWANPAAAPFITPAPGQMRIVAPSAVSHTYSVRGYKSGTGNGSVRGTAAGVSVPGFLRIWRVLP